MKMATQLKLDNFIVDSPVHVGMSNIGLINRLETCRAPITGYLKTQGYTDADLSAPYTELVILLSESRKELIDPLSKDSNERFISSLDSMSDFGLAKVYVSKGLD
jgi:hypothetical protein